MKKNWISFAALAVAFVGLGAALAVLLLSAVPAGATDPRATYRLEKLNEINNMVLARQTIADDYFYYVSESEALCAALREYNAQTCVMYNNYFFTAKGISEGLFYEHTENPGDYWQPDLYYEWVARISHLALYRNTQELCYADPVLRYPLAKEGGGSAGLWAWAMHKDFYVGEEQAALTEAYFIMIDNLLAQLEQHRQTLGVK